VAGRESAAPHGARLTWVATRFAARAAGFATVRAELLGLLVVDLPGDDHVVADQRTGD
jgi:hypothetical protein